MLTEISYPVTGTVGSFKNTFSSQKPIFAEFNRKDGVIDTIVSGVDTKVRIAVTVPFVNIQVGQFITFQSDGYLLTSAKVLSIIDGSTIDIDLPFSSSNETNGFINYHRNYFLEIRFVAANSASDDQDASTIIDDTSQIANSKNGDISANISLPAQLISADFNIATGLADNLFKTYKIQFRESFEGDRSGAWISPVLDIAILLVHGSVDFEVNDFGDPNVTKRYVKGYPLIYALVYSGINDVGSNSLRVILTQQGLDKTILKEEDLVIIMNLNGVYIFRVDTNTLESDTTFVTFSYMLSTSNPQYEPSQYDPGQYA